MARWSVKLERTGLLDYAKAGKQALNEVRKATRQVLNLGRKEARRKIGAEFQVRTGFLKKQARRMQTKATVTRGEVRGVVSPIPRLMNIFEKGATLAKGRGVLRPRPVVTPAATVLRTEAHKVFDAVLRRVGK